MELSNFELTHKRTKNGIDYEFLAEVDVTTGALWWKKTERKKIRRKVLGYWHFVDNGQHTPGFQAERLAEVYDVEHNNQGWEKIQFDK